MVSSLLLEKKKKIEMNENNGMRFWLSHQLKLVVIFWLWLCYRRTRKRYLLAAWKFMRLLHLFLTLPGTMRRSLGTVWIITCLLNLWPCLLTISHADRTTLLVRLCILNAKLWSRCSLLQLGPSMVGWIKQKTWPLTQGPIGWPWIQDQPWTHMVSPLAVNTS